MSKEASPDHSIIERPWDYRIVDFHYHVDVEDRSGSYIDLILMKGSELRRLRFVAPQNLKIEPGFPEPTHGLCILDIQQRGLEGLGVEVCDFESSTGAISFFASKVIDLNSSDQKAGTQ